MNTKKHTAAILNNDSGMVLITVLLLLAALIILGTTAVKQTTTDLKISGNYRASEQALYAAEAGVEEARARMRSGATGQIVDSHPTQTGWTAFIGIATKAQAKGYNSANAMHLRVESLQSTMDYIVKIKHQTSGGSVLYWGDTDNDGLNERSTAYGEKMKNIYLVTSTGFAGGAQKTIITEMTRLPPINAPAALYVEADTTIQGTSTYVIGTDSCGGASLPGIVTTLAETTVTANGNPKVCGVTYPCPDFAGEPWDVVGAGVNMDIDAVIDDWKKSADYNYNYTDDNTDTGMAWGVPTPAAEPNSLQKPSSCSASNVVYYNMNGNTLKLAGGTTGCGLLLVDGELDLNGGFNWYGMVIVTGSIAYTGGGAKNVTGAILSGGSLDADLVGGNANIIYCSSAISDQTQNRPLKNLSWQENM